MLRCMVALGMSRHLPDQHHSEAEAVDTQVSRETLWSVLGPLSPVV